jgi:hypothetical protein
MAYPDCCVTVDSNSVFPATQFVMMVKPEHSLSMVLPEVSMCPGVTLRTTSNDHHGLRITHARQPNILFVRPFAIVPSAL